MFDYFIRLASNNTSLHFTRKSQSNISLAIFCIFALYV